MFKERQWDDIQLAGLQIELRNDSVRIHRKYTNRFRFSSWNYLRRLQIFESKTFADNKLTSWDSLLSFLISTSYTKMFESDKRNFIKKINKVIFHITEISDLTS